MRRTACQNTSLWVFTEEDVRKYIKGFMRLLGKWKRSGYSKSSCCECRKCLKYCCCANLWSQKCILCEYAASALHRLPHVCRASISPSLTCQSGADITVNVRQSSSFISCRVLAIPPVNTGWEMRLSICSPAKPRIHWGSSWRTGRETIPTRSTRGFSLGVRSSTTGTELPGKVAHGETSFKYTVWLLQRCECDLVLLKCEMRRLANAFMSLFDMLCVYLSYAVQSQCDLH